MDIIISYVGEIAHSKRDIMEEYISGWIAYPSSQSVWMNNMIIWI